MFKLEYSNYFQKYISNEYNYYTDCINSLISDYINNKDENTRNEFINFFDESNKEKLDTLINNLDYTIFSSINDTYEKIGFNTNNKIQNNDMNIYRYLNFNINNLFTKAVDYNNYISIESDKSIEHYNIINCQNPASFCLNNDTIIAEKKEFNFSNEYNYILSKEFNMYNRLYYNQVKKYLDSIYNQLELENINEDINTLSIQNTTSNTNYNKYNKKNRLNNKYNFKLYNYK